MRLDVLQWWFNYKHGWPLTTSFFRFECFPKRGETIYREFEAADDVPLFKSGKRKGQKNFAKATGLRVGRILEQDYETVLATYESVTGKCHQCEGDAKEWIGWSNTDGHRYRPCKRCGATGNAPHDTRAAS